MKLGKADIGVSLYIVIAFLMLIIPVPSWLLDIFLAFNIAIAFTIMFGTMFTKEVLDMSYYPTMLLFTTIFRIALNVSSTRLILRDMHADAVVIACLSKAVGKGGKKEGQDGERHGVKLILHGYQPLLLVFCFSKTSLSSR